MDITTIGLLSGPAETAPGESTNSDRKQHHVVNLDEGARKVSYENVMSNILHFPYCRSGNFRVFKFSPILDFETFQEI